MFHRRKAHAASYYGGGVFYTFSFSLPLGTNIHKLADRLLSSGIATAAGIAGSDTPLLGRNYSKVVKARKLMEDIIALHEACNAKSSLRPWIRTHPRSAFHLRRLFFRALVKRDRAELLENIDVEEMRAMTNTLDLEVLDITEIVGGMGAVDRSLFSPLYLRGEPFIRLDLKPFYTTYHGFEDAEILAFLLLHRSGTALLSFATLPGDNKTTDDLLDISNPHGPEFDTITSFGGLFNESSEGVEKVLDSYSRNEEGRAGYTTLNLSSPIDIVDVYSAYSDAIRSFVRKQRQNLGYFCYTTVFVGGLGCCRSRKRWMTNHAAELAGLALRHEAYGRLDKATIEGVIDSARALHADESRFHFGGNSLLVEWKFDRDDFSPGLTQNYMAIAVIENAVLQHWQLHSLQEMVDSSSEDRKSIPAIERELISGLTEVGRTTLSHGTAQDISADILRQLHTSEIYARVTEKLSLLRQLAESNSSRSSDRRNILAATLGAVAAIVFGIPAVRDSLGVISQAKFTGRTGQILTPVQQWAARGPNAVLVTYLCIVAIFLIAAMITLLLLRRRRKGRAKVDRVGIEWGPKPVTWEGVPRRYRLGIPVEKDRETEARS
ncbi:hypothetical protein OG474_38605 [Kribbella sp. NBC_01505]|uniref:hypothetical protein n=1 Tax=Kribbella sp. NBC_01505 TaxID=2903580 RepID=UPI0038653E96